MDSTDITIDGAVSLLGDITPTSISATTNDWAPTSLSTATVIRASTNSSIQRSLNGLTGGTDGRVVVLMNVGSGNIQLSDEAAGSSAANRFALGANFLIYPDESCILIYDATSARWRMAQRSTVVRLGTSQTTAALSGTQNNYALTSSNIQMLLVDGDGTVVLTGVSGGSPGYLLVIKALAAMSITYQDAGSSVGNRFSNATAVTINVDPDMSVTFMHDGTYWNHCGTGV